MFFFRAIDSWTLILHAKQVRISFFISLLRPFFRKIFLREIIKNSEINNIINGTIIKIVLSNAIITQV